MNQGRSIFSQLTGHLPHKQFTRCVQRYEGERYVKSFSCMDQYLCMAFAQLTFRESLRDIECCLRAHHAKLYHIGIRSSVSRSTLAHANDRRDWRIWADFAYALIDTARELYANDSFGVELSQTAYAFDSITIDLCLSLFPWARFRKTKAAVKAHTLLDLRGNIPCWIHVTSGAVHDVNVMDLLPIEPGSFYILDRGYLDFARLHAVSQQAAFFLTRIKSNTCYRRLYSRPVDKSLGLRCDQTIVLTAFYARRDYPDKLRLINYVDPEAGKALRFIPNNFIVPAMSVAELYRCRWQVELFFRWIKQHLRIKSFFGTSENAGKTQIFIAVSVNVLVAIVKKRLHLEEPSLHTILQPYTIPEALYRNQLELFEYELDSRVTIPFLKAAHSSHGLPERHGAGSAVLPFPGWGC